MHKLMIHIIRILAGATFVTSAFLKLFPIEPFELYIYSHPFISWSMASFGAVLIIAVELSLGLFLIFNIFPKRIQWFTLGLLAVFTLYLLIQAITGNTENCHCFGEIMELDPIESILKNLILIAMIIFLLRKKQRGFKWAKIAFVVLLIGGFATPFLMRTPDVFYKSYYAKGYSYSNEKNFSEFTFEDEAGLVNFGEGKKVLCFFSTGCKFCKLSAKKISILSEKLDIQDQIYFVFTASGPEKIPAFFDETESDHFRHTFLPIDQFFPLSGKRLPSIYFVEDGQIVKNFGYRGIFQKDFDEFLNGN